ncbi:HAD family hydrolase [Paenibacillus puerhi]|uniref:HAD family hydrolase n=1 Tax=Paenibacillus puerhi TaxID=2692622 RepID=UPI00135BDA8B|nr:HAD-IA family hydrolase [Paenibacillus puerhi]
MIKAVIFDLDDTLISERKYIESGYHYISNLLSLKLQISEKELYRLLVELFNQSSVNVFNRLFDTLQIAYTKNEILELVEHYRNHLPSIDFFDDVVPCLINLKKRGLKVGIITDGYANSQYKKLDAVKAFDYFDEIIVTDELGREYWKPHPKAFEIMKERMNFEFDEMIYVGDNPKKDFYINSIYPIRTVRIAREYSIYKYELYYENIRESLKVTSLLDLNKLIQNDVGE